VASGPLLPGMAARGPASGRIQYQHGDQAVAAASPGGGAAAAGAGGAPKLGRNDPCYCGSGKKFKRCHGA
jgi:preprotein translocase subunit SecA